jgi:hypothetical protein
MYLGDVIGKIDRAATYVDVANVMMDAKGIRNMERDTAVK